VHSLSESLSSEHRSSPHAGITALLVVAFLTAFLWACGAPSAQATKGGVPAAPDPASAHGGPGNGQGHSEGVVPAAPDPGSAHGSPGNGQGNIQGVVPAAPEPGSDQASQSNGSDGNGANDLSAGPYDPDPADPPASGVGEPSGNGNSTNNNRQRPCAGCVGNADYKNPPGQLPDGTDHNRGYECDGNQGVGKMNPAHSRCKPGGAAPPVTPPVTPPTPPLTPPTPPLTPPTPPLTPVTPPLTPVTGPPAETPPGGGGEEEAREVLGVNEAPELPEAPPTRPVLAVIPVRAQAAAPAEKLGELPFTGGEPLLLGLLGLLALAAGLALARVLRPRSQL